MYFEYWGFNKHPFNNVPEPEFFFSSANHSEALSRLIYAVQARKGAAMLTGGIGCGKTTISRIFNQHLKSKDQYQVILIENPTLSPVELLQEILIQIGGKEVSEDKGALLRALKARLTTLVQEGKECVLIIDEAQSISDDRTFEEIRLLLNLQHNNHFLITAILIGQDELKERVARFKSLEQRISITYHLSPLNPEDTTQYIFFRLIKAGADRSVFTKEAIEVVYRHSRGIPRKINNICDVCLLVGSGKGVKVIDVRMIESVIEGING